MLRRTAGLQLGLGVTAGVFVVCQAHDMEMGFVYECNQVTIYREYSRF